MAVNHENYTNLGIEIGFIDIPIKCEETENSVNEGIKNSLTEIKGHLEENQMDILNFNEQTSFNSSTENMIIKCEPFEEIYVKQENDECDITFSDSDHVSSRTDEKPKQCDVCNEKFAQLDYQLTHEKPYQCDVCYRTFAQQSHKLKINEEMPLKFDIKVEPKDDNSLNLTECAEDTKEPLSRVDCSEIVCEDTKVDISYYTKLSENMCIDGEKKNFKSAKRLKGEPMNENSLNLTECGNGTLIHSDGRETPCKNSKINSGDLSGMSVAECREEEKNSISTNYERHKKATEKKYYCDTCNGSFTKSSTLKTHMRIHTAEKPFLCEVCNKCFSQLNHLIGHRRTHGKKPYPCDVCNKCFTKLSKLNIHKRTHTGEKPYQCDVCNKYFSMACSLNIHKRTHTGEKPYQCDVCNKCFSVSKSLIKHKLTHTGEKPYQCDVCNKCFSNSSNLIKHKRTHTGVKPYRCDACDKCFSNSSNLIKHKRTHTGVKPYRCDVCNKCFMESSNLNRHKRICTSEKSF